MKRYGQRESLPLIPWVDLHWHIGDSLRLLEKCILDMHWYTAVISSDLTLPKVLDMFVFNAIVSFERDAYLFINRRISVKDKSTLHGEINRCRFLLLGMFSLLPLTF